jgi:hypothetical protein
MDMTVEIDKDKLDFLMYAYFGSGENSFFACSKRAYRDMCRTLRLYGNNGDDFRKDIDKLLEQEITNLLSQNNHSQTEYDDWHERLCNQIVQHYIERGVSFTIGQAQKRVNMIMKYLYIHGDVDITPLFDYLHVPLDNYMFDVAEEKLFIKRLQMPWSKIDDYQLYLDFQKKLRIAVDGAPLRWEFGSWLEVARESSAPRT